MLRLFETGQREELRIIDNLRAAGICVWDRNPDNGKQWDFNDFGGHFSGSLDGVIQGITESTRPHVLECKTASDKNFKILRKKGVKDAKYEHYCQMIVYMAKIKLDRAYYICVNKSTDEIYGERIYADNKLAEELTSKAKQIIFSDSPLDKLGDSESSFCCKWCDYYLLCWNHKLPEVNCRSCARSTPEPDGTWSCTKRTHPLSMAEQLHGCPQHLYIPALVGLYPIDAGEDWVEYAGGVKNGEGGMSSEEMKSNGK
jgi:hypothetical protein